MGEYIHPKAPRKMPMMLCTPCSHGQRVVSYQHELLSHLAGKVKSGLTSLSMKRNQYVTASSRKGGVMVYMGQKLRNGCCCDGDAVSACSSDRAPFHAIYKGLPRTDLAGASGPGVPSQGACHTVLQNCQGGGVPRNRALSPCLIGKQNTVG